MSRRAIVTIEFRFYMDKQGNIYTDSVFGDEFWERYLQVFDFVTIVARAKKIDVVDTKLKMLTNKRLDFFALPHYVGPIEMLTQLWKLREKLKLLASIEGVFILRVPSFISIQLYKLLLTQRRPFILEVVGDPLSVFSSNSFGVVANLYRKYFTEHQRKQCLSALGVSYVTESTLQKIYPASESAITSHYSSIELPDSFFSDETYIPPTNNSISLVFVGSLAVHYKGLGILLESLKNIMMEGYKFELKVIGHGQHKNYYEEMTHSLGLASCVKFLGFFSDRKKLRDEYTKSNLFVTPAFTEGLPRVVIEAMAVGLPVIGTKVGGIPELVDLEMLFDVNDVNALSNKLKECFENHSLLQKHAERNRKKAENYRLEKLQSRRNVFFSKAVDAIYGRIL